jgi:23S rRNA pseudoU1915 N3-methylase RlmH
MKNLPSLLVALVGLLVVAVVVLLSTPASAQEKKTEKFFANIAGGQTRQIEVGIDSWSPEEERKKFLAILIEKGQEELVKALRETKAVGYMRIQGGQYTSSPIRLSSQGKTKDGKRHIILVTDRPIGLREAARSTQSIQYDLTVIELLVDDKGKGQGAIAPGAKVSVDKETNRLKIETFQTTPTRLINVYSMN